MVTALLYGLVALAGAVVLSLEILGTRVLGPFYGVSLYLWSALISVTLLALSAGYAIGGRWADHGPRLRTLGWILGSAGIWVILVPWMRSPVLGLAEGFGLRGAVLVAALVLFAPPLTLLGTVSPYTLRLKADRLDAVGRTAGDLFAVSTVASVGSALATGFWLIPALGVGRLLGLLGATLLVGAAVAMLADRRMEHRAAPALLLLLVAGGSLLSAPAEGRRDGTTIALYETPYAEVRVLDRDDGRYLLIDGGVHTVNGTGLGRFQHRHVPVMLSTVRLFDDPGRALVLGLGGGALASALVDSGWTVDAVEIDPGVVQAATRYFRLDRSRVRVHLADARRFLRRTPDRFDLILVDVFGSASIPFHLVTVEMFEELAGRLTPGGIVAMNVEARRWDDPLVEALGATLRRVFTDVWALPTAEPPNTLGNIVLVGARTAGRVPEELPLMRPEQALQSGDLDLHWMVVQQNHAWDNRYEPGIDTAEIFTDDRSRVDLWAESVNRVARRQLHEFFAREGHRAY